MKGKWLYICFILIILSIIKCEDTKAGEKDNTQVTEKAEQTNNNKTVIPEVAETQSSSTVKREPSTQTVKEEEKKEEVKESKPKEEMKESIPKEEEIIEKSIPKENTPYIPSNSTQEEHHLREPENSSSLPEYTYKNSSTKEDAIARNWIYIFTVCITICLVLFIYNVIKCYTKNPIVQQPSDTATYSKELQQISANEDDVLDMS